LEIVALKGTLFDPAGIDWKAVDSDQMDGLLVVPYSNQADVMLPFGFTDPFNCADVAVTPFAASEVTVGPVCTQLITAPQTVGALAHAPHTL